MPDTLSNIDYSQYANWPVVRTPSGGVYYQVPGTSFVYDPFLSQAKKKPVLWKNPTQSLQQQQQQANLQQEQIDMAKNSQSVGHQLLPIVGGVAGLAGAKYIGNWLTPSTVKSVLPNGNILFTDGTVKDTLGNVVSQATNTTAATTVSPAATAFTGGGGGQALLPGGEFVEGPGYYSSGAELGGAVPAGQTAEGVLTGQNAAGPLIGGSNLMSVGGALGAVGGALGAYSAFQGIESGNKLQAGLGGAAAGAEIGSFFGPGGSLVGAGIGGAIGLLGSLFHHKSTKEYEKERTDDLMNEYKDHPELGNAIQSLRHPWHSEEERQQQAQSVIDPEQKKITMQSPTALWGSYGMLKTFGPDYFNSMNEYQRYAATKAGIDAGLFKNDHGDILVTDPDKLKGLAQSAYGNQQYQQDYATWKKTEATDPYGYNMIQGGGAPGTSGTPETNQSPPPSETTKPQAIGQALASRLNQRMR